ncbi:MAG: hypothetical protein AB8V23_03465 [Candidatus Midichloria sp.]|uniref:Uncharacterized protein n=1 Tax=Hyalomma marginatum TaxID=34627 RepID=A0A8S4C332_9ACAR|nr:hypothetical protein MHYMCMPSP_00782 [Hyalomma marginatum]CAG7595740.1 hypothetical protein MHYMCMPASI_00842 [Hyalomma marginatum]
MHNNNNLTIKVTPTYSIRTKEEIVSVKLRYGFEKLAPYLSVGYSSAFINDGSWHFFAEFGLMYQRQSSISSIITGRLTQVPGLLDHLKKKRQERRLMKIHLCSQSGGLLYLQVSPTDSK